MPWVVTGECSQCGDCCGPPVVVDNPCIERGQERCMFFERMGDGGRCQIKAGIATPTQVQVTWYRANCLGYPDLKAFGAGMVPLRCAFSVVEGDYATD